jgi:hypothetical protein
MSHTTRPPTHHPLLTRRLTHLATKLHPLLSITTGLPHPSFPRTLLHYHLLTTAELDDLAHYYHQRTPSDFSLGYPAPVVQRWHVCAVGKDEGDEGERGMIKRILEEGGMVGDREEATVEKRRFGRFVGLRGCESPEMREGEARREMERWMEGEMRKREEREREREGWRGKGCW